MNLSKQPTTTLLYGDSGDLKTTNLYHIARDYLENNPDKTVRLISCSGGGWLPFEDSGLIESGKVDVLDLNALTTQTDYTLMAMKALSNGFWPIRVKKGGNLANGKYHLGLTQDCLTNWETNTAGMYLFEDLTALGQLLLSHIGGKETDGEGKGAAFKHAWSINEDGYRIGGLQQGHYGVVQTEVQKIVKWFKTLPIDHLVMTSLVGKGDDTKNVTMYGPSSAGNKLTDSMPSWFMDTFHLCRESVLIEDESGKQTKGVIRQAWFRDHPDPITDIPYKTNIRWMPEYLHVLDKKWPEGYIPITYTSGVDEYYKFSRKVAQLIKKKLADAKQETK